MGRNRTKAFKINPSLLDLPQNQDDKDIIRELLMGNGESLRRGGTIPGGIQPLPKIPKPSLHDGQGGLTDQDIEDLSFGVDAATSGHAPADSASSNMHPWYGDLARDDDPSVDMTFKPDEIMDHDARTGGELAQMYAAKDAARQAPLAAPPPQEPNPYQSVIDSADKPWEDEMMATPPQQQRQPMPQSGGGHDWGAALMTALDPEAGLQLRAQNQQNRQAQVHAQLADRRLAQQQEYQNALLAGKQSPEDRERALAIRERDLADKMERYKGNIPFKERAAEQASTNEVGRGVRQDKSLSHDDAITERKADIAKEAREAGPGLARQRRQQDPVLRDKMRQSYDDINLPLKNANEAWKVLKANPDLLNKYVKFGSQGKFGLATQLTANPQEQAAIGALEELLVGRGFGQAGKAFSGHELKAVQSYMGTPISGGFSPFRDPSVLSRYLGAINEARKLRKRNIELEFPDLFTAEQ